MDIVIRNGIIDKFDTLRLHTIKNEQGLLKKNYKEYNIGTPGPYYDLHNAHLCIARKYNQIANFNGPQNPKMIKLIDNSNNFNKKDKFCCICHSLIKQKVAFSAKRKIFIFEDEYLRKEDEQDQICNIIKKLKLSTNFCIKIDKWSTFFNYLYTKKISEALYVTKIKKRIISNFEKIVYKILYKLNNKPYMYTINIFTIKLLWPWELTRYQKFKLEYSKENPQDTNYKNNVLFSHNKARMITTNYVKIE